MFYVLKLELGAFATTGLIVESSEAAVEIEVEVEIEEMLWDRSRNYYIVLRLEKVVSCFAHFCLACYRLLKCTSRCRFIHVHTVRTQC